MLRSLWNRVVAKLAQAWNWLLGRTTIDERIIETVDNAKRTVIAVKDRVEDVVEEVQDVMEAVKEASEDVIEEVNDVAEALRGGPVIEGKVTKSKLRGLKKKNCLITLEPNLTLS